MLKSLSEVTATSRIGSPRILLPPGLVFEILMLVRSSFLLKIISKWSSKSSSERIWARIRSVISSDSNSLWFSSALYDGVCVSSLGEDGRMSALIRLWCFYGNSIFVFSAVISSSISSLDMSSASSVYSSTRIPSWLWSITSMLLSYLISPVSPPLPPTLLLIPTAFLYRCISE